MPNVRAALIRVLCVDDHPVVRGGLTQLIDLQSDMKVVAAAASGEDAVDLYRQHRPDITLMDLQLPGLNGLGAIHMIRKDDPSARIVVLTMYEGEEDIVGALNAGACAYLLKDTLSHDLLRTIRAVHDGQQPLPPHIAARLAMRGAHPILTRREIDIIELIANGMRNKEIATALAIAEETVHAHVKKIFVKLHVNDRTAAISIALRRGIIHLK